MAYGVYMAAKNLKHYFDEHPIKLICEAPISEIMSNKYASGWIVKWATNFFVDWAKMQYEPPLPDSNY